MIMLKSTALIIILTVSHANCQFYYNYEEEGLDEPQPETQETDSTRYQYNPPSTVNERYVQPNTAPIDNTPKSGRSRTHIRVRSRNYPPDTSHNEDASEQQQPEVDAQALRQARKQERKRQRERMMDYAEPHQPPRTYSPSIFERIGLGEAPSGVYVPHDSLLNVLKSPARDRHIYQPPIAIVPPTSNIANPVASHVNEPRQGFFVQPPSNQQRPILPVAEPQTAVAVPARQARAETVPSLQGRSVDSGRQTRSRSTRRKTEPVVDIDSYREHTDEIQIMPKVEYITATDNRRTRPTHRSRIVRVQSTAPRIYSPSVFENIALGEAPNGIHVPEDSLLNVLRNPSAQRSVPVQVRRYEPSHTFDQPTEEVFPVPDDEEEYEPPTTPSPTRRSSHRSRQSQRRRPTDSREHTAVQYAKQSSHNADVDDFERQPRIRQRTTRRPTVPPRPRPQVASTRGRHFKEAKLALAELPLDTDDDGIPGEAGTNYPTLHVIPRTSFSCSQQSHNGYYADLETSCQVVHLCQAGGVKSSFLCPNGTIFNQEKFSCQWWYKVNCNDSPKFYIKNDELYKIPEKKRN